jgi:preprotein translocase subunit SecG
MNTITQFLPWIQIIISILLIIIVLLQRSGEGLDGAFGGGASVTNNFTRRGVEKILFYITLILAILFIISAIIGILV